MSASFGSSLSPIPASISIHPRPSPTSHGRVASRMRFRLSGGAIRSQSVFGTTPNMAPPSSAK